MRDQHTTKATYPHVFWVRGQGPAELTSDEWWMTRLCQLRNKIVHGEEVPDALWEHEGQPQLNHIHDRLIGAMQAVVAERSGDPALRLAKGERVFDRMADEFARHARLLGEQRDAN